MENVKEKSFCARKNIEPTDLYGAETRWKQKTVLASKVVYDGSHLEGVVFSGQGTISLDQTRHPEFPSTLKVMTHTVVENVSPRPRISLRFHWDAQDFTAYNRVEVWVYPEAVGYQNFYYHFSTGNEGCGLVHAPSLEPNRWNRVLWEMNDVKRDAVKGLSIVPALMGCPPEALPELSIYIAKIEFQTVIPDYEEGWAIENRIAYCHSGYPLVSEKIALTQNQTATSFTVRNLSDKIVLTGSLDAKRFNLGTYKMMDFSSLCEEGEYVLEVGDERTHPFIIHRNPYLSSIWKSLNFLRSLRCGEDVEGVHSACHLNCRTVHPDGRSVPNFGGWHDAGDVSQFLIPTAEIASALIDLAWKVKETNDDLYRRLLEEAKVGVSWLLRTRFGDGYRAMAVLYSYWRGNILDPNNQTVLSNPAENGPFENFLAAEAELKASIAFRDIDSVYADWCYRTALEDYHFAKEGWEKGIYTRRWGPNIESQTGGAACLIASDLYERTKDESYLNDAIFYAGIVLNCQQKEYPHWEKPIRGFFYEDQKRTKMLAYEHRGHEQSPIQGLVRLMEVAPLHAKVNEWRECVMLYREYIMSTIAYSAPYGILPGHVYDINKINIEHFTIPPSFGTEEEALQDLIRQAKQGIRLNEDAYLRLMPIAIQRRGYLATLLSKAKAVSMMASTLKDDKLMQIVRDQIEWTLGKNPFATSQMVGEGYNYHPLYVAYSKQMVGSLPVGFKTLGDHDAPYWPVANNAVYKEIWGHTTGKYLWVLADLMGEPHE
ncbi:MAG: glycoside hydrolase family 9 protein [Bacilli bacterium]|nr:glycoside hydrolase family 9 protein [Bacilli bacterium]